ncbi:type II toxin-antitoxin system VapC family toxin [Candidatus Shapirobacteria bacterium]|nr:type II toxin-antitoxin system VapC family toxin [Candidatus Shapirobacteria bacterium]
MVKKYLLDTGVLIDLYRGDERANILKGIEIPECEICSVVTAEFFQGVYRGKYGRSEESWYKSFIEIGNMSVISFDEKIAKTYALIQSKHYKKGMTRPIMDLIIAATAIEKNLILVTNNLKHFEMIEGLRTYKK